MIKSESGFGLLEALVVLIIASIAIAGLFMASIYARAQAVENYHYRSALLQTAGQLELIKWYNHGSEGPVNINIFGLKYEVAIDDNRQVPLKASLSYEVERQRSDRPISLTTVYDRVIVTAKWKEKTGATGGAGANDSRYVSLVLVEDYYYQLGGF